MKLDKIKYFFLLSLISIQYSYAQQWPLESISFSKGFQTYDLPFVGGFTNPQFNSIDLNLDGTMDVLVFDRSGGAVLPFIRSTSNCNEFSFEPKYQRIFPNMISFLIAKDYNGDDIPDLFTFSNGTGIPGIDLYEGKIINSKLAFERVQLQQAYPNVLAVKVGGNLSNVEVSSIDIPAIYDVNSDGDLDVLSFVGRSLYYYENQQVEKNLAHDAIYFELADDCWGKFYEDDFSEVVILSDNSTACAEPFTGTDPVAEQRHSGSCILAWDPNKDGLTDILIGDLTSSKMVQLYNHGTIDNAFITEQDASFPSYDTPIELEIFLTAFQMDTDCDGDLDILVSNNTENNSLKTKQVLHYRNTGTTKDSFEYIENDYLSKEIIDLGLKSAPTFVDINADGLLDIIVGVEVDPTFTNTGLVYYRNKGTINQPSYTLEDVNYLNFAQYADQSEAFAPVFYDMDNDGDLDLIVGDADGKLFHGTNTAGVGKAIQISNIEYNKFGIDVGDYAIPEVADLNGDGLPDFIIGERTSNNQNSMRCGNINYFQNIGTANIPDFNSDFNPPNNNCLGGILTFSVPEFRGYSAPNIYNTGDSLLFFSGNIFGNISRYSIPTDISNTFDSLYSQLGLVDVGAYSVLDFANIDADDKLEMIIGNQGGGLSIYQTDIFENGGISGTSNENKRKSFSIFPNPIGKLNLLNFNTSSELLDANYSIFNAAGKLCQSGILNQSNSVIVNRLNPGLYLIQIKSKNEFFVERFIVK